MRLEMTFPRHTLDMFKLGLEMIHVEGSAPDTMPWEGDAGFPEQYIFCLNLGMWSLVFTIILSIPTT
jgi:hypothetical protein